MKNYYCFIITEFDPQHAGEIITEMVEAGFNGFEEKDNELLGYVDVNVFNEDKFQTINQKFQFTYQKNELASQNWNALWESNFDPVIIKNFVAIRAHFHEPIKNVQHEIIITPKMSFGTGHHATTYMMGEQMHHIDFASKQVFDFGTGTGLLAILAEKLGASKILATDNDEWSILNAQENIENNNCKNIQLQFSDVVPETETFQVVLANINKHVLIHHMKSLEHCLENGGTLLLSGLLHADEADVLKATGECLLTHSFTIERSGWICMKFIAKKS